MILQEQYFIQPINHPFIAITWQILLTHIKMMQATKLLNNWVHV